MPEDIISSLITFGLAFVPALFGIICHEVAHGYTAYRMGDPTAKSLGRLTLNPIRHIDPVGFGVFAFTALTMPFVIGWAKPVPVQPMYFRRPRQGMVLVSLAGPMTNFLVALLCALIVKFTLNLSASGIGTGSVWLWAIHESAMFGIVINCALAWFNLMPIPPLDGSHILAGLLPLSLARAYSSIGRYGMFILLLLLATGAFSKVILPLIMQSRKLIFTLVGL
ncbi:site-2 protease family protein [Desulfovibrio sp. OttesenSCG-928-F20]|nr:site-2 protease family protein [Desulfovibrio sp. OttesenSCG-928-M16]MDL2291042.1 site-2 protease family protein [Desulfovibrio sp. OttesenSCG-928-F20]